MYIPRETMPLLSNQYLHAACYDVLSGKDYNHQRRQYHHNHYHIHYHHHHQQQQQHRDHLQTTQMSDIANATKTTTATTPTTTITATTKIAISSPFNCHHRLGHVSIKEPYTRLEKKDSHISKQQNRLDIHKLFLVVKNSVNNSSYHNKFDHGHNLYVRESSQQVCSRSLSATKT